MDIVEFQGGKYRLLTDGMGGFKLSPVGCGAAEPAVATKSCTLAELVAAFRAERDQQVACEEASSPPTALEINDKAMQHMRDRAATYDQALGERSMGKTVIAFNAITGRDLTESEGWLLLQVLKDVRQWQNPNEYHQDSGEDCIAYAALKAESLAGGR